VRDASANAARRRPDRRDEHAAGWDPLVASKLRPARADPRMVVRRGLVDRMVPDHGRRLTLLSAPAGCGKTTLLGAYVRDRDTTGRPVAWLSLDDGDNDPRRFASYLVGALRAGASDAAVGQGLLDALRARELLAPDSVARALVNEVNGLAGLDLVLDDYHVIEDPAVHDIVRELVDRASPDVHVVISSRTDPPLPLARWRAAGHLVRLSAADLAFTTAEATAFLRGVMGLDLSRQDIAVLEGRTEGWVAGLQLAALSMRGRTDLSGFVESFSGMHRDVVDYLGEEVLRRQPAEVREFLLSTSILNQLTGPLCDAVTGRPGGQQMLEALERDNLFVVALDDERCWYRYHHLFADVLRNRLSRERPVPADELHRRAAAWYEANGHSDEAVGHAVATGDVDLASRLIAAESGKAWSRGEVPTVLRWLEALPTPVKDHRPRLLLQQALAMALTGRPGPADELATAVAARDHGGADENRFVDGFSSAVRSWCARLRGDAPGAVRLARVALELLPEEAGSIRAFAAACLGDALWTMGDLAGSAQALVEAAATGRSAEHVYATLSALTLLTRVQLERGRLRDARDTLQEAQNYLAEHDVEHLPAAASLHVGTGVLLYEGDDLAGAEHELDEGLRRAELTRNVTDLTWAYIASSRLRHAQGDEPAAVELARTAQSVARRYGADLETAQATAWLTRLHTVTGARRRPRVPLGDARADAAPPIRLALQVATARTHHAAGRHREALRVLDDAHRIAAEGDRERDLIEITTLQALACWASSRPDDALATLRAALAMAEPEGYLRTFVDEGPAIVPLVAALARTAGRADDDGETAPTAGYLQLLTEALDQQRRAMAGGRLASPLTAREAQILRLVAEGRSNRGIAAELVVTVGTVKTHLNSLYGKLGAHSRTQALARARELDLDLPTAGPHRP